MGWDEIGVGGAYRIRRRNCFGWHCVCCNRHRRRLDYRRRIGWDCGRVCCCWTCGGRGVSCCCVCRPPRRSQIPRLRSRLDHRPIGTAGGGSGSAIATCFGSGPCGGRSGGIWSGATWSGGLRGCRLSPRLRRRRSPFWVGGANAMRPAGGRGSLAWFGSVVSSIFDVGDGAETRC